MVLWGINFCDCQIERIDIRVRVYKIDRDDSKVKRNYRTSIFFNDSCTSFFYSALLLATLLTLLFLDDLIQDLLAIHNQKA